MMELKIINHLKLIVMRHQLHITDLDTFLDPLECTTQIASAFNNGENKSLNVITKLTKYSTLHSYFTVERNGVEQIQTVILKEALVEYNIY